MNAMNPQTRQAVLPTGEVLHFAADMPDDMLHAHVRQKMGLPPPEMPVNPADVVQKTADTLSGIGVTTEQLASHVLELTQRMGVVIQLLQRSEQTITAASQNVANAVAQVSKANEIACRDLGGMIGQLARVSENVARSTQQAATAAQAAGDKAGSGASAATKALQALQTTMDKVVKVLCAPRKAVKDKDGNWLAESVVK